MLDDSVVVVELDVAAGFYFGVEGLFVREREPKFDLVSERVGSFLGGNSFLNIDCTFGSLGVHFDNCEFIMDEIVGEKRIGLPGVVGPRLDFNGFWL